MEKALLAGLFMTSEKFNSDDYLESETLKFESILMAVISTQIQSHLALRFIESHHILEYESVINVSSETSAGVILCIEKALAQSGVSRGDFNYINAHATPTPFRDLKEYNALIHCFGQNTPELGAAGAVEAVATVQHN
ncbi:hypothetical protein GBA52_019903 [Prunus armeniaca]|nr:hypothetical protein GBA52_019903 [Prunus armeniaca]